MSARACPSQLVHVTSKKKPLSREGRKLLTQISEAGHKNDWIKVKRLFASYSGTETQIFNAVMQIAIKCGQCTAGEAAYRKLCNLNVTKTRPTFTTALKLFAALGQQDSVLQVWAEARNAYALDGPLATARLDAAASTGDVEAAARILDEMQRSEVEINILHMTCAIRACWEADGCQHNAATYLFNHLLHLGLMPDMATFTALVGAYRAAPLDLVLKTHAKMKGMSIAPNRVFAEVYLTAILAMKKVEAVNLRTVQQISNYLKDRPRERLEASRSALADVKSQGIVLSRLSQTLDESVENLLGTA